MSTSGRLARHPGTRDGHKGHLTAIRRCRNWRFDTLLQQAGADSSRLSSRKIKLVDLTLREYAGNRRRSGREVEVLLNRL